MDDIKTFIVKLEAELDEVPTGTLRPETSFRHMEGWSSMHALIIIAFIDSEYNVVLTGDDLRQAETVSDIYAIISNK